MIKIYNFSSYPCSNWYLRNSNTLRGGNRYDERGPLLPFLAGVLVTTPFIFLNKNNQQSYYPQYQPYQPYYPYPQPVSYPYPYHY